MIAQRIIAEAEGSLKPAILSGTSINPKIFNMLECALLIPCYNAAAYLPALWEQLLPRRNNFKEIIFLDDGSTDETLSLLRTLPVQVLTQNNAGVSQARNTLAQAATAEWLCFLDADDQQSDQFLTHMLLADPGDAAVIVGDVDWVDAQYGNVQLPRRYKNADFQADNLIASIIAPIGVIGAVIKRSAFMAINGFRSDLNCWEDADLFVRLAGAGYKFVCREKVVAKSMRHGKGLSRDRSGCADCRLRLLQDYQQTFGERVRLALIAEGEMLAAEFARLGKHTGVKQAVDLVESLGQSLPRSKQVGILLLKKLLPNWMVFELQVLVREISSKRK